MFFRRLLSKAIFIFTLSLQSSALFALSDDMRIETMAENLKSPWSMGFLPNGEVLITERGGKLKIVRVGGKALTVKGVPKVVAAGQGGLLDVLVPRNFDRDRVIFLTFSKKQGRGAGTAVARATLSKDGSRLENLTTIFEMSAGSSGGRHFGSRLVEARDGSLFVTIGDRGDQDSAQDLSRHNGAVIRISKTGAPLKDNPFLSKSAAQPEIWSYGHRNPQGAALDLGGNLWVVEHGAKGGDEVNRVRAGRNYGWPVISYGTHYSGAKIGDGTSKSGMQQPEFYWDPSIAPSGMMIYSGKLWPEWRGDFLIGSLKFGYISRLSGANLTEVEQLKGSETKRVRDVREAPDGTIWFLSEDRGALYRLSPKP